MIKTLCFILLLTVPAILAQDYAEPELDYDNSTATCHNVYSLIASTHSDISRLTHFVQHTLKKRISRLNNIVTDAKKTCGIITQSSPSLIQISGAEAKKRLNHIHSIRNMHQQAQDIASTIFENQLSDAKSVKYLHQIKKTLSDQAITTSPKDLCNGVYTSVPALVAYLTWLQGAVTTKYINGLLAQRLSDLTTFQGTCGCTVAETAVNTSDISDVLDNFPEVEVDIASDGKSDDKDSDKGADSDEGDKDSDKGDKGTAQSDESDDDSAGVPFCLSGDKYFKKGQILSFRCAGSNDPNQQYLDMYAAAGGIILSPTDNSSYPGTHWKVDILDDGTCSFASQRWVDGYGLYLCGMAGLTVGGAPETGSWFTGSHITPSKQNDGTYALWSPATPWWDLHYITCNPEVTTDQLLNLSQNANDLKTHWVVKKVTNGPRPLFQDGDIVSVRSRGNADDGDFTYLAAYPSGQHYYVPSNNDTFGGAHWEVTANSDGSYTFSNLHTPSINLGGSTWDLNLFADGSYTMRYLGNSWLPKQWYFADPSSKTIELANNFSVAGTFFDIDIIKIDDTPVLTDGAVVTIRSHLAPSGTGYQFLGTPPQWTAQYLNNNINLGTTWKVRANSDNSWSFINQADTNTLLGGSAGGMSISIGWEMFGGCTWQVEKYKDGSYTIRNQGNVYLPLTYMVGDPKTGIVNLSDTVGAGAFWEIQLAGGIGSGGFNNASGDLD